MPAPPSTPSHDRRLADRMELLEKRLYGNGQPGDMGKVHKELERLSDKITRLYIVVTGTAASGGTAVGWALNNLITGG